MPTVKIMFLLKDILDKLEQMNETLEMIRRKMYEG